MKGCNDFEVDVRDIEYREVNLVTIFRNASLHLLHTIAYGCICMTSPAQTHCLLCSPPATVRVPMTCASTRPDSSLAIAEICICGARRLYLNLICV